MSSDPRAVIAEGRMSRFQVAAVATTIGLNGLDGFDVMSISFAAPGIAAAWGIDRGALGIVLAMELIGMAAGSVFLGNLADRIGRRPTILGCLVVMTLGMALATTATDISTLCIYRVFTGLGIGGMLAAINAMSAEFSNARSKHTNVALMAGGYPIGAVLGGSIAALLLRHYDWRSVFYLGAILSALFIPLVLWRLPESVAFLTQKQPRGALERINATLRRMGHATVAALPDAGGNSAKRSVADIFGPALLPTTILVTCAYFMHVATFYFIVKWVPKIVVDMGFAASSAAGVLVWANLGGAFGSVAMALAAKRFALRKLTIGVLIMSFLLVTWFGSGQSDLSSLALVAAIAGIFTNAGIVGLYAIFAHAFPTHVRATGTGFAIGVGRGGAAISPIIAGFLFQGGFGLQVVALTMACGSLIGAIALFFLKFSDAKTD